MAPIMSDQPDATSDQDAATTVATASVTVEQAAAILGVSVTTVRRRIRAGSLRAEEARRPQGPVWLVYLPADATPATAERPSATSSAATAPTTTPAADAMVSLIQTTIGTVLGPLVGQLDAQRQTIERQAGEIAELREDRGRLTAEVEALKVSQAQQDAHPGPVAPIPATDARVPLTARLRALAPWVFGVLMIIIVGVMLWTR
jgi:hypothetical protein